MKTILIFFSLLITACAVNATNLDFEKINYKSWVLSRCISHISDSESMRQDALNTASAYFEMSTLPVESFVASEPLIQKYLSLKYEGSIAGTFNNKKCIDLFNSNELEILFNDLKK